MTGSMCMAAFFLIASAVAQADQCSSGGECKSSNEPQSVVSLLQTKLQMTVPEESVEDAKSKLWYVPKRREPQSGVSLLQTNLQVNVINDGVEATTAATQISPLAKDDQQSQIYLHRLVQTDLPNCSASMIDQHVSRRLRDIQASYWDNVFSDASVNIVNGGRTLCRLSSPGAKAPFVAPEPSNHIWNYHVESSVSLPGCLSVNKGPPERQTMKLADGKLRSYSLILPPNGACSTMKKCPLTVWLCGCGCNHGPWRHAFWYGLASYASHPDCLKQMGTALLVLTLQDDTVEEGRAQPDYASSHTQWDGTGEIDSFVIPAVRKILAENPDIIDQSRVRIAGFSTGGAASMLAAVRYPDIFERGVAAQGCSESVQSTPDFTKSVCPTSDKTHVFDPNDITRVRPDGISPGDAMPKRLQGLILGLNDEPTCIEKWSVALNRSSWLADTPSQMLIYPTAKHNIWDMMVPLMFDALFKDVPASNP